VEKPKTSEFAGRRSREPAPGSVPAQDQPSPIGTGAGDFDRNPCGTCWHWKRNPRAGLDVGFCMFGPPVAFPVPGPDGRPVGNMLTRPTLKANTEGCDQWNDESEFEDGDGSPAEAPQLAATG
jgi:hypothetical protein